MIFRIEYNRTKIKRTVSSVSSIFESFIHPSQKPFSMRLFFCETTRQHNDNTRLIKHYRKFLLFSNNDVWKKTNAKLLRYNNGKF